ncbi:MAG: BatD family protein [Spirochaetes bacterium]|nr:BatD family protein [Spirochaetota bacterium]
MKRTGSILLSAAVLFAAAAPALPAQLETVLEEPAIEVGDSTTLRVKISGDPEDVKPVKYPSVPGLRIEYSGMQQSYQYINGKSWSGVELLFSITALRKGRYRIPAFEFRRGRETLRSGEVVLVVSATAGGGGDGEGSAVSDVRPSVELSAPAVYVGQPVIMRYYILSAGTRATVHQFRELPENKGFAARQVEDPVHDKASAREGEYEKTHLVTFALIPAGPGNYNVGGGSAIVSVQVSSPRRARDFFGNFGFSDFTRQQELVFDARPVTVRPLPAAGRPDGFQGDIGSYTMKAECPAGDIKVFEEKKVSITVTGTGNLVTMTKPALEREAPGLKVLAEEGEMSIVLEGGKLKGSKKFTYTLIPDKPGPVNPGRFRFSFFNPDSGRYETVESGEISFTAKSDGGGQAARFDEDTGTGKMDMNILYIALIALAIAGMVVFVVLWERRKYRLATALTRPEEEEAGEPAPLDEDENFMEAARCIETTDRAGFLRAAEKAVDHARRAFTGTVPEKAAAAVSKLKDEIYGFKYGGVTISTDDMKRLCDEIAVLRGMIPRKRK